MKLQSNAKVSRLHSSQLRIFPKVNMKAYVTHIGSFLSRRIQFALFTRSGGSDDIKHAAETPTMDFILFYTNKDIQPESVGGW